MDDQRETIKQLEAEKAVAEEQVASLSGQLADLRSDFDSYREKADKAIETLAGVFTQLVGKDGIKVALPTIGLDTGVLASIQALSQQQPNDSIAVNLIVNGVEEVEDFLKSP